MATKVWRGDAAAVAQITSWTFGGTWEADDVVIVTIGNKTLSVTAGSTTLTTVVDNVVTAFNASTIPEFAEITASRSGDDLVLTADTAGVPFTAALSTTEAGGGAADAQTITGPTAMQASKGPNHYDDAGNWEPSGVPVDDDVIHFQYSDVDCLYGIDQDGVAPDEVHFWASYTGHIGLPIWNAAGYREHRQTYLKYSDAAKAIAVYVHEGFGNGSGRIRLDTGASETVLNVFGAGSPAEEGIEAVVWKGTHAANVVNISRGSLGVAIYGGEVATIATLRVGYQDSPDGDAQVRCGQGLTLTTLHMTGGQVEVNNTFTTLNKTGGTLRVLGTAALTNLNEQGGTTYWNSSGGVTGATPTVSGDGRLLFTQDMRPRTIDNTLLVYKGATVLDPSSSLTLTAGFRLVECKLEDVTLDFGVDRTLEFA